MVHHDQSINRCSNKGALQGALSLWPRPRPALLFPAGQHSSLNVRQLCTVTHKMGVHLQFAMLLQPQQHCCICMPCYHTDQGQFPAPHKSMKLTTAERLVVLDQTSVVLHVQGQLPCLTPEGKIIMASPHALAKAPDGNGGVYLALAK